LFWSVAVAAGFRQRLFQVIGAFDDLLSKGL
jgi:hypothetical protein